jgi:hypothetical protein
MNDTALIDQQNPVLDFNAMQRCDACGQQALVLAGMEGLSDLLFCGHHITKHATALRNAGWTLIADNVRWEEIYGETFEEMFELDGDAALV